MIGNAEPVLLFSRHQTNMATVQEVEIDNPQGLDLTMVEGLADDGHIQFLHGLCLFCQFNELLCPEGYQRVLVVQLGLPPIQKFISVLQHGIPCHHKSLVQIRFQERVVDAAFDLFAFAPTGTHPSLDAPVQSVEGPSPEKLTADTAEYSVGERLLVRVAPHRA